MIPMMVKMPCSHASSIERRSLNLTVITAKIAIPMPPSHSCSEFRASSVTDHTPRCIRERCAFRVERPWMLKQVQHDEWGARGFRLRRGSGCQPSGGIPQIKAALDARKPFVKPVHPMIETDNAGLQAEQMLLHRRHADFEVEHVSPHVLKLIRNAPQSLKN